MAPTVPPPALPPTIPPAASPTVHAGGSAILAGGASLSRDLPLLVISTGPTASGKTWHHCPICLPEQFLMQHSKGLVLSHAIILKNNPQHLLAEQHAKLVRDSWAPPLPADDSKEEEVISSNDDE